MQKRFIKPGIVLASLALIALPACSSSEGGTSDTKVDESGVKAAQKIVTDLSGEPTSLGLKEKLNKLPTGKVIYELEFPGPIGQVVGDNVVEACKALGCKVVRVPFGTDPATVQAAWDRAIADKPDAVVTSGVTSSTVGAKMKKLRDEGVPVVALAGDVKVGVEADVAFGGTERYATDGAHQADWIVADSKGSANILAIDFPDFTQAAGWKKALTAETAKTCPSCKVSTLSYGFAIAKQFPGRLVSYLQQHPDINYIAMVYGDQYVGVQQALSAADLSNKVKIITRAGTALNFRSILDGGPQKADVGNPIELFSWGLVDAAARLLAGQDAPAPYEGITQFLTKDTITFDPATTPSWLGVKDYKDEVKKSWGVN